MPITLVPTPIGNRDDITLRALEVLRTADRIAAEDTRHTGRLLQHFEIKKPLVALHAHNEHGKVKQLIAEVQATGEHLAVVSDAGTPGISDPGFLLVREAIAAGVEVICLPGPTAFVPALVASGLPCDRFVFEGFLPPKKGRKTRLESLADESRTLVFYESPFRLVKTLRNLAAHLGERPASVAREISKLHEEFRRGTLTELAEHYEAHSPKGECVVVVGGRP